MSALYVILTATGEVVSKIDTSTKTERQIDKIEMGLLRNMNLDEYHVERAGQADDAPGGA